MKKLYFIIALFFSLTGSTHLMAQYCIPSYSTGCASGDTIDDFIMADAGINHIGSGCSTGGYGDFTADPTLLATVEAGESYSFSATHGFGGQWLKVWIDLDGNGSFEDPGELLFTSAEGGSSTTGSIAIPGDAESITTRMRVMGRWNAVPTDSCDPGGLWGETHDYTVEVIGGGGGGGDCDTVFTDTGGPDGNYGNSENIVWTFNPDDPGNEVIVATFTAFNVENNFDNLFVYDGPDTSSPLIATLTGTTIPGPITSTHATGALTFNFISDGSVNRAGWIADITCESVGGGGEECEIVYSGSGQDGLGTLNGGLILSNDFRIIPDQTMTVESVTLKILSDVTSVNVGFLANNGNAPGAVIMAPVNIVPTSQTFVGVTPFGSNIYEVLLDLPTSQVFEGGASGTNYWITVSTVVGTEGDNYWEFASSVQNGTYFYYSPDGGATWVDAGTVGFFVDGAMTLSGECEGGTEPEGCEWTVNVFDTGLGDEVSWELRDASNAVLLSGGPYGSNYNDTQTVISGNGPMTFYIEAMGSWNDNTPSYTVSNGTEIVASGTLLGGDDATYSDLECEEAGGGGGDCDSGDLTTIFSGGNQFAGNMFDVTAIGGEDILIEGFDINIDPGTATISVYTRPGTYVGFENSSAGWTLMGSEVVTSAGENMPTFLDIGGLTIPAGEVYGFYVTVTDYPATSMNYTNGDFVYTDDYLQINTGVGKANPDFTGSTFASRSWNGTIYYCAGEGSGGGGECEQSNPTNPVAVDNGYNIVPGSGFGVAADVVVPADEDFTLEQVTIRVLDASTVTSVNLNYYSDAAGLPGTLIGSQANITPTSSTFVGVAFGWNIYEVVLDITPFTFEGQSGSTTTYWVQPETPTFWEVSYASVVGSVVARLSAGVWTLDTENNAEAVYVFSGTCEPTSGGPTGDCDTVFTDTGGPDGNYGNSENIVWTFNPDDPGNEVIVATFTEFDVENGWDNLHVYDGPDTSSPLIATLTGTTIPEPITSTHATGALTFNFISDVSVNRAGWVADITCETVGGPINNDDCDDAIALSCGDVVTGTTVGMNNSGGNTAPDVFYSYTGNGEVEFVTVSLCGSLYDTYLRVYSDCDLTTQIAFNDDFCGLQSQLTFESDGVSTYIIMVEGFGSGAGEYTLELTCAGIPGCGDQFTDTGGTTGNYGNSEDIIWTFTPNVSGDLVTVTFSEFDVETNWDNLYVYDGPDLSSPLIATLTGTTIPDPITSTHATGALTFNFISDGSVNRAGWVAEITCEPEPTNDDCEDAFAIACGDTVSGTTTGMNDSGGNPAPDVFYEYTGNGQPELVTISLCGSNYDTYLRVFTDCDLNDEVAYNDDYCGIQSQLAFMSDGTSTYIIMVEGFGSQSGDYTLEVTCEALPGCGDVFTDTGGPSGNYGANENLTWTFTPNAGEVATLTFNSFDVEAEWDALYVFDGPDANSPMIGSGNPATGSGFPAGGYYGNTIPGPFTSTHASGALTVVFMSDGSIQNSGWTADVTCGEIGIPDGEILGFVYYPNPVVNILNIQADTTIDRVEIYNVLGQTVLNQNIGATSAQLNVGDFASGVYLMKVTSEGNTGTYQVIRR